MGYGKTAARLDRVTEGVAEVQLLPRPGVKLVRDHRAALILHAGGDDGLQLVPHRRPAQRVKKRGVVEHPVFDDLAAAAAVFALRERGERVDVAEDETRLVKAARLIFPGRQVDGGLAADGGVHRGEQRCRHLNEADAALISRRGKARKVAHDAAAERDNRVAARQTALAEKGEQRAVMGKVLARFPGGDGVGDDAEARVFKAFAKPRTVKREDVRVGNDGGSAPGGGGDARPGLVQQPAADQNVVAPRGVNADRGHRPSTSALRRLPSSSSRMSSGRSFAAIAARYSERLCIRWSSSASR